MAASAVTRRRRAWKRFEIINQPLASIAKREEILYVYGQEKDPLALDHHSPVLHLIQLIRDEAHRFRRHLPSQTPAMRDRSTELMEIPASAKAHSPPSRALRQPASCPASGCVGAIGGRHSRAGRSHQ